MSGLRNAFIFNDELSTDYGVFVESPVDIVTGEERVETLTIPGSAKVLHIREGDGAMKPAEIPVECVLRGGYDSTALAAWLRCGGELILPGDVTHSRRAWVKNGLELQKILRVRGARRFQVKFECEAWRYQYPPAPAIEMTQPGRLENPGTGAAAPLIKVYGSGNITLMIGSRSLLIDDVQGYVCIDLDACSTYKETESWMQRTRRSGDWPLIPPDGCMINWTSGVTKLEITPRWRDY